MKTPEHIHDTVEALRWFVSYYPKLNGFDPRETMEYAANLIESMYEEFEQLQQENAGLSIMLTSAQSAAKTWKRKTEAIQCDFGEFAARINTGEDLMGCEYCNKNYAEGECNCNCLKDFEWIGVKEGENE